MKKTIFIAVVAFTASAVANDFRDYSMMKGLEVEQDSSLPSINNKIYLPENSCTLEEVFEFENAKLNSFAHSCYNSKLGWLLIAQ
jgi:hypothetical protein